MPVASLVDILSRSSSEIDTAIDITTSTPEPQTLDSRLNPEP